MAEQTPPNHAVDDFVQHEIDGIPHLEALLLLWNSRPRKWPVEEMGAALYVNDSFAQEVLHNLARHRLVTRTENDLYSYHPVSPEHGALMEQLDIQYRRNLIHITRMIHSKASPGVREFANAFRFKKERD